MKKKRCRYCLEYYLPSPQTYRRQKACRKSSCQAHRRRSALQRWRLKNPTYDDQRERDHRRWRSAHPGYWRTYRATHPGYENRNRRLQRQRDRKRRFLANRNDWDGVHSEKMNRIRIFGHLANRNDCRVPFTHQTEEICRYLEWRWLLAKRNEMAKAMKSV